MNKTEKNSSDNVLLNDKNCTVRKDNLLVIIVVFGIILHLIFFANFLIVCSVWKFSHLRRTPYILIANISVSNNVLCLYMALEIVDQFGNISKDKCICLSKFAFVLACLIGSEYNMLLMSTERFVAVLYPLKHKSLLRSTRLRLIIVICWIFYFILAFLPLMGWNASSTPYACHIRYIWTPSYFGTIGVIVLLGFTLNFVLFLKVLYAIQCTRVQRQPRQHRKTTWISFCILFGFVICWGPVIIGTFIHVSGRRVQTGIPCLKVLIAVIGTTNGLVTWVVYGMCNKRFREGFKAILTCSHPERTTINRRSNNQEND